MIKESKFPWPEACLLTEVPCKPILQRKSRLARPHTARLVLPLSTEGKNDFSGKTKDQLEKIEKEGGSSIGMLYLPNKGDKQIYVFTVSDTYKSIVAGYGIWAPNNSKIPRQDLILGFSSSVPHEKAHRDTNASERAAYTIQLRVLRQYGPGAFMNKEFYRGTIQFVRTQIRTNKR